jgi:hypothetical protein
MFRRVLVHRNVCRFFELVFLGIGRQRRAVIDFVAERRSGSLVSSFGERGVPPHRPSLSG